MGSLHHHYMRAALQLARRNLGQTWPNPSVGALIVKDGCIVGQGYTARGGRPHAETQAIEQAGAATAGADLYVTLEPCSHHGKTPPCAEAVTKSGIARVISACRDPNPLVSGRGIELLQQAGIEVIEGISQPEASELNRGFFSVIHQQRPFISLKLATSLDGKIATASGESQWITGEAARQYGHLLRSRYDAIATGINTVQSDDPLLTCRLPGLEDTSPVRILLDSKLQLSATSNMAKTAKATPLWVITSDKTAIPDDLEALSIIIMPVRAKNGLIDLPNAVKTLAERGITRLLVEAGAKLSTAFLQSGLVDRIYWFRAPFMIGNDGLAAVQDGFSPLLAQLARWKTIEHRQLQSDTLEILECSPASSPA